MINPMLMQFTLKREFFITGIALELFVDYVGKHVSIPGVQRAKLLFAYGA